MSSTIAWRRLLAGATLSLSTCAWAAGNGTVGVAATVPSKNNCKFNTKALTLDFGNVDPASTLNATAGASLTFVCNGAADLATFFISAGDGLYPAAAGERRMRHASINTEFLAYALTLNPTSASVNKGDTQTLAITGSIQPFQFQNVQAGAYQDTVVLTITP